MLEDGELIFYTAASTFHTYTHRNGPFCYLIVNTKDPMLQDLMLLL